MRKIFVSNVMSVDGYFEGPNKAFNFFTPPDDFFEYARNMMTDVSAIIYGRVTYKFMEAYWPHAKDNDAVITERMNNLPKIVFSKTLASADWYDTTLIRDIVPEEIIALKQQPGNDMVILGSGEIVSALANLGLIDEYRVIVAPIILGGGTPLFKGIDKRLSLQLTDSKILSSGAVLLYYRPVPAS
jgi:dihydrofolate reductase